MAVWKQVVHNVFQDTMVMELHVPPALMDKLHLQVVLLQLQQNVSSICLCPFIATTYCV